MEKKSALETQQGGNHYKTMKLQPVELGYKIGATPCFVKLAKYLTRNKNDKKENLEKAFHCICLEQELSEYTVFYMDNSDIEFVGLTEEKAMLIDMFSDNVFIRNSLAAMYDRNYKMAKQSVKYYALEVLGEEVGD